MDKDERLEAHLLEKRQARDAAFKDECIRLNAAIANGVELRYIYRKGTRLQESNSKGCLIREIVWSDVGPSYGLQYGESAYWYKTSRGEFSLSNSGVNMQWRELLDQAGVEQHPFLVVERAHSDAFFARREK